MAKRSYRALLFGGWRKWVLGGVAAAIVVGLLVSAIWGKRLELWWVARDLREEPESTMAEIRGLGRPYRGALRAAVLSGSYDFAETVTLFDVAFREPFYLAEDLRSALGSDDETVRRAAVVAYLEWDRSARIREKRVADDVLDALRRWARPENATSVFLGAAISRLGGYGDPRIPEIVVPLLLAKPAGEELTEVGRSNDARQRAARLLAEYAEHPEAVNALVEVVRRDPAEESDWVQTYAWQSLAAGGYAGDPELYWVAARSPNHITRQMVAGNLERVKDPAVIPVLEALAVDPDRIVRRGALDSLAKKRAPVVIEDLHFFAEDSYSPIRGDLALAVRYYRSMRHLPYLGWCLADTDPMVVQKALESLHALTGKAYAFDPEEWQTYSYADIRRRQELVEEFMNDPARKAAAIAALGREHPPVFAPPDRVPHLVRMLGHADPDNVLRAIRELAAITGRTEGFDPAIVRPGAPADDRANALFTFTRDEELRGRVIADWKRWLEAEWPAERERRAAAGEWDAPEDAGDAGGAGGGDAAGGEEPGGR